MQESQAEWHKIQTPIKYDNCLDNTKSLKPTMHASLWKVLKNLGHRRLGRRPILVSFGVFTISLIRVIRSPFCLIKSLEVPDIVAYSHLKKSVNQETISALVHKHTDKSQSMKSQKKTTDRKFRAAVLIHGKNLCGVSRDREKIRKRTLGGNWRMSATTSSLMSESCSI